jgi:hypothetical protein
MLLQQTNLQSLHLFILRNANAMKRYKSIFCLSSLESFLIFSDVRCLYFILYSSTQKFEQKFEHTNRSSATQPERSIFSQNAAAERNYTKIAQFRHVDQSIGESLVLGSNKNLKNIVKSLLGIEPRISCSVGRRTIHCAIETSPMWGLFVKSEQIPLATTTNNICFRLLKLQKRCCIFQTTLCIQPKSSFFYSFYSLDQPTIKKLSA